MTEPMQPFYDYLTERRRVLLDELEQIERLLGTSPRTSQIRKAMKGGLTHAIVQAISQDVEEA